MKNTRYYIKTEQTAVANFLNYGSVQQMINHINDTEMPYELIKFDGSNFKEYRKQMLPSTAFYLELDQEEYEQCKYWLGDYSFYLISTDDVTDTLIDEGIDELVSMLNDADDYDYYCELYAHDNVAHTKQYLRSYLQGKNHCEITVTEYLELNKIA